MSNSPSQPRFLIVDDNPAIHDDFRKVLGGGSQAALRLDDLEQTLFGSSTGSNVTQGFRLDSAYQGEEALGMLQRSLEQNDPYCLAFVDVRMPPGWDGIETLSRLWQCCPELQAVICTAYSDFSWEEITCRLGKADSLLILKKPFDTVEVMQLAHAMAKKWELARQARLRMEDLDRMVRERTEALRQESEDRLRLEAQLRQSQKMEAIGCLASGIAHEFNNLLTVIQGHAGLLRGKPADSRAAADSVERIVQASQMAASLTRRLLAFSRKQALQLKPLNLSAAVHSMERMLGRLLGENYKLELDCAQSLPWTRADEASIQQALINLVLNARDSMPNGGRIRIATRLMLVDAVAARENIDARPGQFVCLTVSDDGCGMSPEVLGRIFEPFFTTKEIGKGTGLGLSSAHGIIQQHEGWIEVTTEPRAGSTFSVYLPASEQVPAATTVAKAPTQVHGGCGNGEAVLLVEDEPSVREMARLALEQGGFRVFEAADGPQALHLWEKSRVTIELLLTDMVMPNGLTGGQLARELQTRDPRLRIVYTSGYSSEVLQEERGILKGDNFLPKPYDPLSLLKTVKRCLDKQALHTSKNTTPAEPISAASAPLSTALQA
jgi:signal transduction histidine kinase